LANLANGKWDELHVKIYRYFRWLQDLLLLLMSSSMSLFSLLSLYAASDGSVGIGGTMAKLVETNDIAFANQIDGNTVAVGGGIGGGGAGSNGSKQFSSNILAGIGGGGYYAAGGINLSLLENLMEGMKSAFRVVRGEHHQANGGSAWPYMSYPPPPLPPPPPRTECLS
jgi:hypothetical protein